MLELFHDGGAFMYPILALLIIGLAISFERLYTLSRSSVSTRKLLDRINVSLKKNDVEGAIKICSQTRGPVASVLAAGLLRKDDGIDYVEKAIGNAGTLEVAFLERGLIWMSTVITLGPMLGFTGTVAGMVAAFQAIEKANDISPAVVASGISVALLTTLFGLIVAMIVSVFFNYSTSQIDQLTVDMEEGSAELVDTLVDMQKN